MSVTTNITSSWSGAGGGNLSATVTNTANNLFVENFTVSASSTTHVVSPFTIAGLQSIYVLSNVAVSLKTNSSGSPAQTIAIAANAPFAWTYGSGATNPITTDVTSIYYVNADPDNAATVQVRILNNA